MTTKPQTSRRDKLSAGGGAIVGEGVEITLKSADGDGSDALVSDLDVQLVVNGLWMSGAEAIDVGGNRLAATSAIRSAGDGITVNYKSIAEPVIIRAIGSQSALTKQFTLSPSGRYLVERNTNSGITWTIKNADEISMSAAPKERLEVRHANAIKRGGS